MLAPYAPLKDAAAGWGIASFQDDSDNAIRSLPLEVEGIPSAPRVAADLLRRQSHQGGSTVFDKPAALPDSALLCYYQGAPCRLNSVWTYHEVLSERFDTSRLAGKIVFVGAKQSTGYSGTGKDTFRAPGSRLTGLDWNGVDFHVLAVENHLHNKSITRASVSAETFWIALTASLFVAATFFSTKKARFLYLGIATLALPFAGFALAEGNASTFPYLTLLLAQSPAILGFVLFDRPIANEVFISYSWANEKKTGFARQLVATLEQSGLRCWWDQHDISQGEDYRMKILDGIERSRAFILLISETTPESREILAEIGIADYHQLPKFRIYMAPGMSNHFAKEFGRANGISCDKLTTNAELLAYAKELRAAIKVSRLRVLLNKLLPKRHTTISAPAIPTPAEASAPET